jgi:serine/threonine-protein kinase
MLPERFGRFEVLAEIGDGAMGRVYSAWDPSVLRVVAIKTLKAELLTSDTAADYLKRFRREAVAAGSLNHPQVVRVFDIGDDFLVMEFVEGRTLQAMIREAGRIEPAETLRLLGPVAEAVDHAHAAGIVHRDIKPANVMVQPDGQPKLMDFGVAHLASSVMTTAGQVLGSPSYMSPEQIAGTELTGRSDVYSLAVVAYEMLTGQPPFQGQSITQVIYRVMHESAPPPRRWNAALPERYDDVFARALAKDPAQRYPTATAFVGALDLRELEFALEPVGVAPAAPAPSPSADEILTLMQLPAESDGGPAWPPATASAPSAPPAVPFTPPAAQGRLRSAALALVAGLAVLALAAIGWAAWRRAPSAPVAATPATTLAVVAAPTPEPSPVAATPSPTPTPAPRIVHIARAEPRTGPSVPSAAASPTPPPVVEGQLVELGDDVTSPVRTHGGPAPYPERARQLHLEGSVTVAMIVDENGTPIELQVTESGGPILDAAVLEAVRGWRFEPARKAGVKVKVRWTARQTYRTR